MQIGLGTLLRTWSSSVVSQQDQQPRSTAPLPFHHAQQPGPACACAISVQLSSNRAFNNDSSMMTAQSELSMMTALLKQTLIDDSSKRALDDDSSAQTSSHQ